MQLCRENKKDTGVWEWGRRSETSGTESMGCSTVDESIFELPESF